MNRRQFLTKTLQAGFGLPCMPLIQHVFAADTTEEKKKKKLAKYTFVFSSPYFTNNKQATPHAHLEIKNLIEKHTQNKIFVDIHDGGVDGIGSSLSNNVKYNISQGALISVSNLAPQVPELDVLNVPFWSSSETEYRRLFNSDVWNKYVLSKTEPFRIKVLLPYVVGARTATTTKKYGKLIKAPEDFKGVKFRIPGSKSLQVFYRLTQAIPQTIAWKFCARTARAGRYDALDPSIAGLYAGPEGLNKELGVISEIESVHDGWLAIGNMNFINSLDKQTQLQFFDAFTEIQEKQVLLYRKAKAFCIKEFAKLGTKIYTPTHQEKEALEKAFGHINPAWEPVKKRLLGDNGMKVFDELYKVAKG